MSDAPGVRDRDALRLHLLVLRCQAGDERAFARLFDEFGPRTQRYLDGLVGDGADDVQQEVWLTVYRQLSTLQDPRRFRTWLYRTTRHRAIDHLRSLRRERELFADDDPADVSRAAGDSEVEDSTLDPELLGHTLSQLSPVHREALTLRYRDGLSYADIATVAGCSLGTVRSRIHNARHRLRELLDASTTGRPAAHTPEA
jgi:RNA polymerase sigma-70 factor (ECF subfamily)